MYQTGSAGGDGVAVATLFLVVEEDTHINGFSGLSSFKATLEKMV